MKKVIIKIMPLVFILLTSFISLSIINVYGFGGGHPDSCQPCHGQTGYTTDTIDGNQYSFWNHTIKSGNTLWSYCTNCHSDYTANTVHDALDCMGCHAVLHIGWKNQSSGNWAAWIFVMEPQITSTPALSPDIANFVLHTYVYNSTNATTTISNLVGTEGMEIEVGVWNAFNNTFISTLPSGSVASDSWKVCFSCHFVAEDPSVSGAYRLVGGVWKIGIPEYALKLPPHEITPSLLAEAARGESSPLEQLSPSILLGLIGGIVGIGLVVLSRRETSI
jgi:hypothetical protein